MSVSGFSPARPTQSARARTLSLLFLGGAAIALGAIALLPLPPGTDVAASLVTVVIAIATGLVLFFGADALPAAAIPTAVALGTVVISLNIYIAGDIRTGDQMFYLWATFY